MPDPVLTRPNKKPYSFSKLIEEIKVKEGFVAKPYRDSLDFWTIGYGSLIGDGSDASYKKSPFYTGKTTMGKSGIASRADTSGKSVTKETAKSMMMASIDEKLKMATRGNMLGDKFFDLSPDLQDAAISSFYRGGLPDSPKAMRYIRGGKFAEAAVEFLDNVEYRAAKKSGSGVAARMEGLAKLLKEEAEKKASFSERVEQRVGE